MTGWLRRTAGAALFLGVFVLVFFGGTPRADANGYDYPDLGASALGRGAAFVAKADDPLALYYNPAGAARLGGTRILVGGNLILTQTRFLRLNFADPSGNIRAYPHDSTLMMPEVDSQEGPFVAPLVMMTSDLGGLLRPLHLVLLAGFYGPNSHRDVDMPAFCKPGVSPCEASGPGGLPNPARYDTLHRSVVVFFPSLGLAWQPLPWLSIGAVFQLGFTKFDYTMMAGAVAGEDPRGDIRVDLDVASSPSPTGLFGIHLRPLPWLEFGVSARAGLTFKGEGEVRTHLADGIEDYLGIPVRTEPDPAPAQISIPMPWLVRAGVRYVYHDGRGRELFDVELDYVFEGTSVLQSLEVKTHVDILAVATGRPLIPTIEGVPVPHAWVDTHSLRLGGAYTLFDVLPRGTVLTFRGGAFYETSPMPAAYTRLDFLALERYGLTLGLGVSYGRYRLDIAYAALLHRPRTVQPDAGKAPCSGSGLQEGCGSRVREVVPLKPSQVGDPVGNGRYEATIHLVSLSLRVAFDLR